MRQALQPRASSEYGAPAGLQTAAILPKNAPVLVVQSALRGADNITIDRCRAALQEAISTSNHSLVEFFLTHEAGAEIANAVNQEGKNALWYAIECQNLQLTERLLKLASANEQAMQRAVNGDSALLHAVRKGMPSVVLLLLGLSSAQEQLAQVDASGLCPSLVAASHGKLEPLLWMALLHPKTLSAKTRQDLNALHLAAGKGHLPVVDYLIRSSYGAALAGERTQQGFNVLHLAAWQGHLNVVAYLLAWKGVAAIAKEQTQDGRHALQLASSNGHHEVVRALNESGWFETSSANEKEARS